MLQFRCSDAADFIDPLGSLLRRLVVRCKLRPTRPGGPPHSATLDAKNKKWRHEMRAIFSADSKSLRWDLLSDGVLITSTTRQRPSCRSIGDIRRAGVWRIQIFQRGQSSSYADGGKSTLIAPASWWTNEKSLASACSQSARVAAGCNTKKKRKSVLSVARLHGDQRIEFHPATHSWPRAKQHFLPKRLHTTSPKSANRSAVTSPTSCCHSPNFSSLSRRFMQMSVLVVDEFQNFPNLNVLVVCKCGPSLAFFRAEAPTPTPPLLPPAAPIRRPPDQYAARTEREPGRRATSIGANDPVRVPHARHPSICRVAACGVRLRRCWSAHFTIDDNGREKSSGRGRRMFHNRPHGRGPIHFFFFFVKWQKLDALHVRYSSLIGRVTKQTHRLELTAAKRVR